MGHGEEVAQQLKPGFVATIDCLPDDLLVQILSFLPTKQAASTSVLSKRWRTLFAFTHNLDFDDPIVMGDVWDKQHYRCFQDFVYRTLALQGGNHIKKLSVRVKYNYGAGGVVVLKHWIYYALKHRISELHLCINCINTEKPFFSRVFTSSTLVKVSLGRKFRMYSFPSDISLPALKVLILDSILIDYDQLSDVFLAACLALEDLTVRHMYYPVESYVKSSKTLKRLSFTCKGYSYFNINDVISLNTPNVVDLYYYNYASQQRYLHCNLESLAKATLDLNSDDKDVDETNLISEIRNVKTLHLTFSVVEVISVCCKGGLPVFNNLVDLVFSSKKKDWKVVLSLLLERSPNLKTLVLLGLHRYTFNNQRFVGIHIPPKNQIKMLSIMQYQGGEDELKHISHFLLNMECLEVVKVYVAPTMDDPKKMQLKEDLMKLPTTSSKLKIQIM